MSHISEFDCAMIVGSWQAGLRVSETTDLQGFSRTTEFTQNSVKPAKCSLVGLILRSADGGVKSAWNNVSIDFTWRWTAWILPKSEAKAGNKPRLLYVSALDMDQTKNLKYSQMNCWILSL